ncbi:hypothetical protein D3C76_1389270 [compost metagenome]
MHVSKRREILDKCFPKGVIESIHRTITLRSGINACSSNIELNECFGDNGLVGCFFHKHFEGFKCEQFLHISVCFANEQLKGSVRTFKLITLMLQIFDFFNDLA